MGELVKAVARRASSCSWLVVLATLLICALPVRARTTLAQQVVASTRARPSVVWCDDPATLRLEVTIRNRTDVAHVEFTDLQSGGVLYDNGSLGDAVAGDNVFTGDATTVFCGSSALDASSDGVSTRSLSADLILKNGSRVEGAITAFIGQVSRSLRNVFAATDLGDGLFLTRHALFIHDTRREIFPNYPIAEVMDESGKVPAARKLYGVLPDVFDMLVLTPGLTMFDPATLVERVPHMLVVGNQARNISVPVDNGSYAATWGSAGRLKSAIWLSLGSISIADHELAHTWGAIGRTLNLTDDGGHWNALSDIGGQLGGYYRNTDGRQGHFAHNGDLTWRWVPNSVNERYAPLELYQMGLIGAGEVPPVHLLTAPNLTDLNRITAASLRTITIEEIMQTVGGARDPGPATSQKAFNLAYVVTQDEPFTDAQFAFSSQLSRLLMSQDPPHGVRACCFAPFYWATGGRATLNTDIVAASGGLCGYSRSSGTVAFKAQGGIGTIGVTGAAHCAWTAVTNVDSRDWITVLRPTGRNQGAGNVIYAVKANPTPSPRKGTLTVAGKAIEITQQPAGAAAAQRR